MITSKIAIYRIELFAVLLSTLSTFWFLYAFDLDIPVSAILVLPQDAHITSTHLTPQLSPRPLTDYHAYAIRPLFSPSRLPSPAKPAAAQAFKEMPKDLELLGVMIVEGKRMALLRPIGDAADWVSEGGELSGWKISEISQNSVAISRSGRSLNLLLYADTIAK